MYKLLTILTLLAVFTSGCKKETGDKNKITINGASYSTVAIGQQEWTTVNYNGPGGIQGKFFVPDDNFNKYYTVDEANKVKLPPGWRVPTKDDFSKLISHFSNAKDKDGNSVADFSAVKSLMSTAGWESDDNDYKAGTNSSGFNAYPAGFYIENPLYNEWVTRSAWFLTSTPLSAENANPHATHYAFVVTNLWVFISVDNTTACFGCFAGQHNNSNPKSLRFVRDL
jgi:uncharacterized protein (TIGR02145 family)